MIRATPAYAATLAAIHRASFPPAESWTQDAFAQHLALPGVVGLLNEDGGFILLRVAADEAEILTFAVHPAARRAGIGTALLDAAIGIAAAAGATTMFLEVSAHNHAARALYAAAGFLPAGLRPRYYADGSDALILRLVLTSAATTGA